MALSATPTKLMFYAGNTQAIEIFGLQDALTSLFLNTATITATLQDDNGNPVSGCTNVTLSYVAGSNGNYTGVFGDVNFQPAVGTSYTLVIDGSQSGSFIHLEMLVEIRSRQK